MTRPARMSTARLVLAAGVLLSVALQAEVSWSTYLRPMGATVWRLRALPAWERTAIILHGEEIAGYLGFLRETIPENARIILPPRMRGTLFEHIGMMQYFLGPRDIHNCGPNEIEACVQRATGENTYILALDYFPPRELASETRRFIGYNEEWGVFAPP